MTGTKDPRLLALGQIEADRATGRITEEQYQKARADLMRVREAKSRDTRISCLILALIPLLLIGGCFALSAYGH